MHLTSGASGRTRFAAEAELTVDDPSASMQPGEAFRVKRLRCCVERFRYGPSAPWIEFNGIRPLILMECGREEGPAAIPLGFGDTVRAKGVFSAPDPPLFPGSFDYAAYLEREGIYELFQPGSLEIARLWFFQ